MNVELIKNTLETAGYYILISAGDIIVGKYREIEVDSGIATLDPYCRVFEVEGRVTVADAISQLPKERTFFSGQEAIAYIKIEYPLT